MFSLATCRRPSRARIGAVLSATVLVSGCGALTGEVGDDGAQNAVAAFYPLAWVTGQVAGEDWRVTNLTSPGAEPHDLELSVKGSAELATADLVVYLDGFQPAVDDGIETTATGTLLDAADVVELEPIIDADHEEDHEEDHEGEAEHEHELGGLDPHFWQDPERMATLADAIADDLATVDPDGADGYRDRADALVEKLLALDQAYADGLASCERETIVVSHDAFGYLAKYGIDVASIAGITPDAEPAPAAIGRLRDLIDEEGITTVFAERLTSPAIAETLADEAGVSTEVLDPIEGPAGEDATEGYLDLMRDNLDALEQANGC